MTGRKKREIITFKVDTSLSAAMRGVPNRSEFIRAAILAALEHVCPMCLGAGSLTPDQRRHWNSFAEDHPSVECDDCHAIHFVCDARSEGSAGPREENG